MAECPQYCVGIEASVLSDPAFLSVVSDPASLSVVSIPAFLSVVSDPAFLSVVSDPAFLSVYRQAGVQAHPAARRQIPADQRRYPPVFLIRRI